MWPMGLLFLKTSPVKQYSDENDLSGVFDALRQSFLVCQEIMHFFLPFLDLHMINWTAANTI